MTTEVEVRNFQSIEHAEVTIDGYTAIVGRSNIGKSAIVRAVKAALTGATGTSFVRHGPTCARRLKDAKKCACKTSVRIKREGFDLLWEKGDNDNRYTFNGKVYDSVERGTPEFLQGGYAPIKIGDEKELLQVADQFDPIFLLNRTGGVIADVLSDVAHLDRVNAAMRLVEKDRRESVSTRKVREQDVVNLTQRYVEFDGLDDALAKARAVEEKLSELDAMDKRLRQIERFMEAGAARATEIKHLQGVEGIAAMDPSGLRASAATAEKLSGWYDRLVGFKTWFERVKGLENLPAHDSSPLKERLASLGGVMGYATKFETLSAEVARVEAACAKALDDANGIRAEWEALGVCPTCEQPCGGHPMLEEAV
jgi:hypothetical protein